MADLWSLPSPGQEARFPPALIWGDSGFAYDRVDKVCREASVALEITRRPWEGIQWLWATDGEQPVVTVPAFQVLHNRWVVERTFAWLGRSRRLCRDFEATVASSLAVKAVTGLTKHYSDGKGYWVGLRLPTAEELTVRTDWVA